MKTRLQAGQLDQRVTFMRLSTVRESDGSKDEAWVAQFENVPAEVTFMGGREALRAGQVLPEFDCLIRIRYRDGLSEGDRVDYRGKQYDIKNIKPVGRDNALEITAKVVAP